MIEPTDADIVEARDLVGYGFMSAAYIREQAAMGGYQNAKAILAHARTLAKLRVAMEALGKVARDRGGFMGEYHADCQQIAVETLAQIGADHIPSQGRQP